MEGFCFRSRQFDWPPDTRNPGVRAVDGGPRWRSSGKERGPRLPGDVGYEIRRAMARRNGNIRYPGKSHFLGFGSIFLIQNNQNFDSNFKPLYLFVL